MLINKGNQQNSFTRNEDRAGNAIEEVKETVLDFCQGTVKAL